MNSCRGKIPLIYILYFLSIFIALFMSAYILICVHFTKENHIYKGIYTNWHFPMLLALTLDLIYENPIWKGSY